MRRRGCRRLSAGGSRGSGEVFPAEVNDRPDGHSYGIYDLPLPVAPAHKLRCVASQVEGGLRTLANPPDTATIAMQRKRGRVENPAIGMFDKGLATVTILHPSRLSKTTVLLFALLSQAGTRMQQKPVRNGFVTAVVAHVITTKHVQQTEFLPRPGTLRRESD